MSSIDRNVKNVSLTDEEIEIILELLEARELEPKSEEYHDKDMSDCEVELLHVLYKAEEWDDDYSVKKAGIMSVLLLLVVGFFF